MLKVVADIDIPFLKGALEPFANVLYEKGSRITNSMLLDADALITRTRTRCNADLLKGTNVKLIASATIGHDHIDKEYCPAAGIKWINAPGCNAASVQQYFASALSIIFQKTGKSTEEITLGVIGAGNVGKKVMGLAGTLGLKTLVNDPPRARIEGQEEFCSLEELLQKSDIVTVHVPLNKSGIDKTLHLANDWFFEMIKSGAWFVNTSRGEVANTASLKKALTSGKISGAIIDVWENEPHVDQNLLNLLTIATPHIAGYSADGKANGTTIVVREISKFFGLGIDNWSPPSIPPPSNPILELKKDTKLPIDIFCELSLQAYPILEDHNKLVENPKNFEDLRSKYRVRREPPALRVKSDNLPKNLKEFIADLGYSLI